MKIVGRRPPKVFGPVHILAALLMLLLPFAAMYQSVWLSQNSRLFMPLVLRVQSERIECPHCSGLGTVREPPGSPNTAMCPICFGVGGHYVRRLPGRHEVLCPACGGLGRLRDPDMGYARYCRRCGGRGLIQILDVAEPPAGEANESRATDVDMGIER